MFFMGEKKLGRAPEDHDVYELVFLTGADPDRIRQWSVADRRWLLMYPMAKQLAAEEMRHRATNKGSAAE